MAVCLQYVYEEAVSHIDSLDDATHSFDDDHQPKKHHSVHDKCKKNHAKAEEEYKPPLPKIDLD